MPFKTNFHTSEPKMAAKSGVNVEHPKKTTHPRQLKIKKKEMINSKPPTSPSLQNHTLKQPDPFQTVDVLTTTPVPLINIPPNANRRDLLLP